MTAESVASGAEALRLARKEARTRQRRDDKVAAACAQRDADEAREAMLDDYFGRVEELARSLLYAAGFHQHRHEWRRRSTGSQQDDSRERAR